MSKLRVLLTGGSGFIGTSLSRLLLSDDLVERIVNIDLNESTIDDQRFVSITADIRDLGLAKLQEDDRQRRYLAEGFDVCIHLAALCKEPGYEWQEYFDVNDRGTSSVIDLCEELRIDKIIFTSTMMVYQAGEIRRTEDSATTPDTAYGISKLLAEKSLAAWKANRPTRDLTIIRPAVVFGSAENGNFTRLYRALKRGFFPYVGKSSTIKANVYVEELALFIKFLLLNDVSFQTFNFAFPERCTMVHITSTMKSVFGLRSLNLTLPKRPLLWVASICEVLNSMGLKNGVHHRRIEKLYYSTDIYPANALAAGYRFQYDLRTALQDWRTVGDKNF